jgi:hypothetical protein
VGLDVDPKALGIAWRKIAAAGADVHLHLGRIEDADVARPRSTAS